MKIHPMRKLVFPLLLVFISLASAAALTTVTAVTLASYAKDDKSSNTVAVKEPLARLDQSTASR
jgi:hypothetical protein